MASSIFATFSITFALRASPNFASFFGAMAMTQPEQPTTQASEGQKAKALRAAHFRTNFSDHVFGLDFRTFRTEFSDLAAYNFRLFGLTVRTFQTDFSDFRTAVLDFSNSIVGPIARLQFWNFRTFGLTCRTNCNNHHPRKYLG
jgi:hypothetical protein